MPPAAYEGILFSYQELEEDTRRMARLAAPFLDANCEGVLEQCAVDLQSIRNATVDRVWPWQIRELRPIATRASEGEYRVSHQGGPHHVYGSLSFTWHIQNHEPGRRQQRFFRLVGRASTSVLIRRCDNDEMAARWQFEAGDAASPGCHFHSAMNQYGDEGVFPEWLKVPRLPGLILCPMDALEFLLGELYQVKWQQHVSKQSHDRDAWGKRQHSRLQRVLQWQLGEVNNWGTTPWMSLKKAKPHLQVITVP